MSSAFWATRDPITGQPRGVTVDLGADLAQKLGVPVEYVMYPNCGELLKRGPGGPRAGAAGVDDSLLSVVKFPGGDMMATWFEPNSRAFRFRNGTFNFHVGPFGCHVLCGGMAYGALDYYFNGLRLPDLKTAPVEGHPIQSYLYRRQMTAHFYTWHRFAGAWAGVIPILGPLVSSQGKISDIKDYLDHKRPVVLCLYHPVAVGHHVLAIDCDPGKKSLELYDSNFPDKTRR